jgi:hypothetical protein
LFCFSFSDIQLRHAADLLLQVFSTLPPIQSHSYTSFIQFLQGEGQKYIQLHQPSISVILLETIHLLMNYTPIHWQEDDFYPLLYCLLQSLKKVKK